jgi:hypothetical protein
MWMACGWHGNGMAMAPRAWRWHGVHGDGVDGMAMVWMAWNGDDMAMAWNDDDMAMVWMAWR